jgi:23S rRNA (guanine2535-N1)-methyltransferase
VQYRSAPSGDRSDLASGSVLHSAPGYPALPVRLGQELFMRAAAHVPAGTACALWDPCCGSGYLATALALLNRDRLRQVTCSDISAPAVELAGRNLTLLTHAGLAERAAELRSRAERFGKPALLDSAAAADRLGVRLEESGGDLPTRTEVGDVFDPASFTTPPIADLVVTDVPYDRQTSWQGKLPAQGDPVTALLDSLRAMLPGHAVVVVCARTRKITLGRAIRVLERVRVGHRAAIVVRTSDLKASR